MKQKKKSGGLFAEKIDGKIMRQTLRACWPLYVIALVLGVSCALALSLHYDKPAKYELETAGSEIDFAAPELRVHTAEDGIAVVNPNKSDAQPARAISDPDTIWTADPAPTYGGFTLPVAMDGDSIGVLTIPDINLSVRVYESDSEMEDMERGAAHFKSTSAFDGNIGISAHNVNFNGSAGYFLNLHTLKKGAVIEYETALGKREYTVTGIKEISENDWSLLDRTEDNRITLITCITGKPTMRLVVQGAERRS